MYNRSIALLASLNSIKCTILVSLSTSTNIKLKIASVIGSLNSSNLTIKSIVTTFYSASSALIVYSNLYSAY